MLTEINFDNIITIRDVVRRISKKMCIVCLTNLDREFPNYKWTIPLCRECRMKFLEEESILK